MVWIWLTRWHLVLTMRSGGIAGLQKDPENNVEVHTFVESTAVQFGKLSDQEVAAYIATGTG